MERTKKIKKKSRGALVKAVLLCGAQIIHGLQDYYGFNGFLSLSIYNNHLRVGRVNLSHQAAKLMSSTCMKKFISVPRK